MGRLPQRSRQPSEFASSMNPANQPRSSRPQWNCRRSAGPSSPFRENRSHDHRHSRRRGVTDRAPLGLSGFRSFFGNFFGGPGLPDGTGILVFQLALGAGIGRPLIGCLLTGRFRGRFCYLILVLRRCRNARVVGRCFGIAGLSVARKRFMTPQGKDKVALSSQTEGRTAAGVCVFGFAGRGRLAVAL